MWWTDEPPPAPARLCCATRRPTTSPPKCATATLPPPRSHFAKAAHVVKLNITNQRVAALTIEPRSCWPGLPTTGA
jgi:hypothetical protein